MSPASTVWSAPAFTVRPSSSAWTVTATESVALAPPAVTVSVNVRTAFAFSSGAVKLGVAVVEPVRLTFGLPPVWLHE